MKNVIDKIEQNLRIMQEEYEQALHTLSNLDVKTFVHQEFGIINFPKMINYYFLSIKFNQYSGVVFCLESALKVIQTSSTSEEVGDRLADDIEYYMRKYISSNKVLDTYIGESHHKLVTVNAISILRNQQLGIYDGLDFVINLLKGTKINPRFRGNDYFSKPKNNTKQEKEVILLET